MMPDSGRPSLAHYRAISFDCYGTIIDWQTGILAVLRPLLPEAPDAEIVELFARHERRVEAGPYRLYREVLSRVMRAVVPGSAQSDDSLAASLPGWLPFGDAVLALSRLAPSFRLAVASNVDNDLFARTRAHLPVPFDTVVTAEEVRSYKPAEPHFLELIRRLGIPPSETLHVAESRYHDIEPAGRMGFGTVWIDRSSGSLSASGPGGGDPMWTFGSLAALAEAIESARVNPGMTP